METGGPERNRTLGFGWDQVVWMDQRFDSKTRDLISKSTKEHLNYDLNLAFPVDEECISMQNQVAGRVTSTGNVASMR